MDNIILSYLICGIWFLQFLLILIIGMVYSGKKEETIRDNFNALSIIIPFKDESLRIEGLLDSINKINHEGLDIEYLFVNDNSTDNTEEIIRNQLKKQYQILNSPGEGKKVAIKHGVETARHDVIITWDADVRLNEMYFSGVRFLDNSDMWVLPVRLTGNKLLARLGCIDHDWLQMLNYSYGSKTSPLISSGANLMFKKESFLAVDKLRTDYKIASGDDMFLMDAFKKARYKVEVTNSRKLEVTTDSPFSFEALIAQRKRWSSKMKYMKSSASFLFGLLVSLLSLMNILSLLWAAIAGHIIIALAFSLKFLSEYIFLRFYKGSEDSGKDVLVVFVHQFFFPFYLLSILMANPKEKKWNLE